MFRLGSKETVAVAVEGRADQQVRVSLQNLPNQRGVFFTETRRVSPRRPEIWDVGVELADLPDLTLGKAPVYVTLELKCGSLWTRSAQVLVSPKSGEHYFLQTDKPIYHPGSAVKIRFIAMDETLRPSNKKFKVEIQNPQNVTVEARDFEPTTGPMLTHVVMLPEHTLLGEWKVVVKYGYKFEQNETVTFEVKEYVLPRFSVELSTVNYVPDNFTHVPCFVQARFLNTQPVQGVVQYRFGLKSEAGSEQWIGTGKEPKLLNDGRAHFRVDRDSIARRLGAPLESLFRGRYRLVIEATVTEEATAAKQTARNEKAVFSTTPFVISTSKSQKSFKPGVKTYVIAQVTYLNGDAARGIEMQLTNTGPKNLSTKATTDNDGIATFPISTVINDGSLNLKVETIDKQFRQSEQAQVEFQLLKYEHTARGFIAIEKRDPKKKSRPGEIYEAVLFTNSPNKVSSVYYVVLSRGRILKAEVLEEGQIIERGLKFTVTPEMTPSFRIVTFARIDGHIVSDSIYVSAEPTCSVASQFNVTLAKSYNQQAEPGSSQTLVITGTPGTQVGILGVDQAVYLLRRKDLLTREKLFQQLDAKDLGCGAGGGTDSVQALYDAGVLLLANTDDARPKRNDLSCQPRHRQKREAPLSVEDTYKDPVERECCSRGLKRDKFLRSCSERVDVLREYRDHDESLITEECIEAFATCCERNEELEASARSGDKDGDSLDDGEFEFDGTVRHDFRETSLFNQYTIGENRRVEVEHTLPHSITTWEVNAVSTAPSGGICASEALKIVTFKSVFVEINVPYSVRKNEQVEIPATVYNYGQKDIKAKVALLGTQDICSGTREGERSAIHRIDVPSGHGRTVIFPVIPLATGERYIQVTVVSSAGSDSARVKLRIEHNGAPRNESFNVPLNPTDAKKRLQQRSIQHKHYTESYVTNGRQLVQIQRPIPDNAIPGSEHCEIGITGDKLGPALETMVKNPGSIMSMPTGCGEQTMIKLAPTLYAYQYLRAVGRISGPDEDKALGFIREGYKKILTYRKTDGSFSVWTNYPSSLWLTAFVLRNLCEARKSTMIDEAVITSGLRYMMTQQQHDGSFKDAYHLHHKELLGGVDGPVPLSAYVLLTLQECIKDGVRVEDLGVSTARATNFVENNLESGSPPYTLALGAYALALSDSPNKLTALEWLRNVAVHDRVAGTRHVPSTTLPLTIQGTAYALMAFLSEKESRDYVDGYVRWLNDKMQPTGALSSTQDTVVALQALAKYATVSKDDNIDLTCQVTLNKPKEFKEIVRIKRDNAHQLTRIPIPSDGDKIFVDVTGSGSAHMYFLYKYHVPVEREDICKFHIAVNFEEKKPNITFLTRFARDANNQRRRFSKLCSTYKIKVCARYLEGNATGMAILDVGLLTGFKPIIEDLKKLVTDGTVQFYELTRRSVAFYVESIPTNADVCLEFGLEKEFAIGQIQSSYVKVYSYYDPDTSCTEFYAPDNSSPLLKLHCDDSDVCACAEGGCPPEKPLARFLKESDDTERRESLREFVCDKVDYVWLGTPQDKYTRDGFKYVVFRIKQVLKPGREAEEDLHGKTRHIKVRERCASFNLELNKDYVVMGLDSEYLEHVEHGPDQPLYIMDAAAMVLPKSTRSKPTRDLTTWFIKEFSNEESRCFT